MKKCIPVLIALICMQSALCEPLDTQTAQRYNNYYNNGLTLYKAKNYSSAISEFRKVLRVLPYDITVKNALVSSYLARAEAEANSGGLYKKAASDIKSALFYLKYWDSNIDPKNQNLISSAEENLKKLEKTGITNEDIYQSALFLRQQGELAGAGYDLIRLENSKYSERANETLGDIYKSLNNQQKSIEYYRKVLKTNPKNASVCFKYALIMDDIDNKDAASEYYNLALKNGENNEQLLENLESLWLSRIEQSPNNAEYYINLGTVLHKKKDYTGAKTQYLKARSLDPTDKIALYNLASLYNDMKLSNEAINIYNEILAKDPNNVQVIAYRAIAQENINDFKGAISSYKTIIQINPNSKDATLAKAEIDRIIINNYKGSDLIDYLTLEANSTPNDFGAQYNAAYELHKQNKFDASIPYYKKAINLKPDYENSYINLAQIYLNKNDINNAKNIINQGLSVLPSNKELLSMKNDIQNQESGALYETAGKYWDKKQYNLALKEYLKIPNKTPEVIEAIASCYMETKDYNNAINYYKQLLSKNPKNTDILLNIASCYYEMGNIEESKTYYNKILTINPENSDAKNAINAIKDEEENTELNNAIKFYENKDYTNAQITLAKILSQNPNNLYANYYRGVIFEEQQKIEEAIIYYKKSTNIDPNFALSYYGLGVIYDNKERYQDAVNNYDKYLTLRSKEGAKNDDYISFVKKRSNELKTYLKSLNKAN